MRVRRRSNEGRFFLSGSSELSDLCGPFALPWTGWLRWDGMGLDGMGSWRGVRRIARAWLEAFTTDKIGCLFSSPADHDAWIPFLLVPRMLFISRFS